MTNPIPDQGRTGASDRAAFLELARTLFERTPLGFALFDDDHRVAYANPAALGFADVTLEQARGHQLRDLYPAVIGTRFDPPIPEVEAGQVVEAEAYFPPTGQWLHLLASPTTYGVALFIRDMSEERKARQQAEHFEVLLRGSLDAMLDPFAITTALRDERGEITDFEIEFLNRAACDWSGLQPDEVIGKPSLQTFPMLAEMGLLDAFRRVARTGEPLILDALALSDSRWGRRTIAGSFDVQAVRFGDRLLTIWRDVTERERSRTDLERLLGGIDQTPDAVAVTSADGTIVYVNRSFTSLLGELREDLVGHPAAEVAARVIGSAAVAQLADGVADAGWLGETEVPGPDGARRRILTSISAIHDADGSVTSYVTWCRDVTTLRAAEDQLTHEARVRAVLVETLTSIGGGASLHEASQRICEELVTLPGIDGAVVEAFVGEADAELVGAALPRGALPPSAPWLPGTGDRLEAARVRHLRERAQGGPWAEAWDPDRPSDAGNLLGREGILAAAYGPIVHDGHVGGVVGIGTADPAFARALLERMPDIVTLTATTSSLLAERLHAYRHRAELRGELDRILATRAFHPVFQPIVDLGTREPVGYEALTRFASGKLPDVVYANAWSVDRGVELELATLEAAVEASLGLPAGLWLDINLSPRLLLESDRVGRILAEVGRPIVVEITEHHAIGDYEAVRDAVRRLGKDVRLAVDDAGAGVANFGHIIELGPDFVKLDMGLVRRVNAHLGRQALVVAMRHFARSAGCRLVAEGIETEREAATLLQLGVEFGQGYLFGRPARVASTPSGTQPKRGGRAGRAADGEMGAPGSRRRRQPPDRIGRRVVRPDRPHS